MAHIRYFKIYKKDAGFVIGSKGSTINKIKQTTGAHVQIEYPKDELPRFRIESNSIDQVNHAWHIVESIAIESYNRRNGVFHHSCPAEKRFVPKPKPVREPPSLKYMIVPCGCVLELPPNNMGPNITKQQLSGYIGPKCNRVCKGDPNFTHAVKVSNDHPITPIKPLDPKRVIIRFSDDSDNE